MFPSAHSATACDRRRNLPVAAWRAHLPKEWQDMVVGPTVFTEYREYEIAASRQLGHDDAGTHCYYQHDYTLTETRSDDDEDYYQVVSYSETVRAWLLRDGRWLIFRVVQHGEQCAALRGFYSFSEQPPR